jgi:alkaline phosphatase
MLRFIRPFSLVCFFIVLTLSISAAEVQPVKYVFLFVGDGMAPAQRQLAEVFVQKTEKRGLKINAMPYQVLTTTHAAGEQTVTDSAAAGTALACGVKTNNGVLGLDAEGKRVESIAELARKNGRKVGIVSSVTINHATPAAFYAHVGSRGSNYDIGLDLIASGFDYFGGGGVAGYNDRNAEKYKGSIYDLAKEAGYTVCRTPETIKALKQGVEKVLAFGSSSDLPYAIDGNREGLRLVDFTKQAIELLDNPNGFFIMVEGGKIDWACHANDGAASIWETIEFDAAVSVAFDFAAKKPGEVLIIVTGDHETGGMLLGATGGFNPELLSNQKASQGTLVSLTDKFVKDNGVEATFEKFKPIITEKCGLVFTASGRWTRGNLNLTTAEVKELEDDFAISKKAILENQGSKDKVVKTMLRLLSTKSGISWGGGGHTAMTVLTSTWGNQAEKIAENAKDNTDIGKLLRQTVGPVAARRIP